MELGLRRDHDKFHVIHFLDKESYIIGDSALRA